MWLSKEAVSDCIGLSGMGAITACAGVSALKNAIPGMSNPKG